MYARYGHLYTVKVKLGDRVKKGQIIGTVGTGNGLYDDSAHLHADFPVDALKVWTSYVFGWTRDEVKKAYADPKPYRPKWYDHMGWGYLELADYSGKKCYHPGEDWNGKGAGNADLGTPIEAPFDGEVVYCYAGTGANAGWGKLVVIEEIIDEESMSLIIPGKLKDEFEKYGLDLGDNLDEQDLIPLKEAMSEMRDDRNDLERLNADHVMKIEEQEDEIYELRKRPESCPECPSCDSTDPVPVQYVEVKVPIGDFSAVELLRFALQKFISGSI